MLFLFYIDSEKLPLLPVLCLWAEPECSCYDQIIRTASIKRPSCVRCWVKYCLCIDPFNSHKIHYCCPCFMCAEAEAPDVDCLSVVACCQVTVLNLELTLWHHQRTYSEPPWYTKARALKGDDQAKKLAAFLPSMVTLAKNISSSCLSFLIYEPRKKTKPGTW